MVCQDSTHKTNQYQFKIPTVVVPDEYHNDSVGANACSYVYPLALSMGCQQGMAKEIIQSSARGRVLS